MLVRRWTMVGDEAIHSRETDSGWGTTRPVVLVHGVAVTSRYFRPLLDAMDGRVAAAAIELPGIGSSTHRRLPEDIAEQAEIVAGWLRATRRAPAILAGNSMGAQTVVEVAIRYPELVDGVVLIGPTVDAAARSALPQIGRILLDLTRERPSMFLLGVSDRFLTRPRAVLRNSRASLAHPMEERITRLHTPTLIVRGSRDPVAPRRWVHRLAAAAPSAGVVEVDGAAHACHHGRPHVVAELLLDVVATPRSGHDRRG